MACYGEQMITSGEINEKLLKLESLKTFLKTRYVGIDDAIDRIIQYLIPWHIFSEAQSTPCVICLWGMTGCGKTSLVQDIVEFLEMSESFTTKLDSYYINRMNITPDKPLIVLFDEIQNENTKELDGSRSDNREDEMWEFMSSGAVNSMSLFVPDDLDIDEKDEVINGSIPSFYWMLFRGKKTKEEKIEVLKQFSKKTRIVLTQALIFVCGNLDGIYPGALNMDDESDADQYYELSKKVTLQDVRAELNNLFFPEHISRLGSNHVIFPAYNEQAYRSMISLKSESIRKKYEEISGRKVTITQGVLDYLYSISVVPSQGARPIVSTVQSFLGFYISKALCNYHGDIYIDYDNETLLVNGVDTPLTEVVRRKDIMDIPEKKIIDCIVHEAGHVVVALKLGLEPFSVSILEEGRAVSNFNDTDVHTSERKKHFICMTLAGRAAQRMVLDDDMGCESDIERATDIACKLIRINQHEGAFERVEDQNSPMSLVENGQHDDEVKELLCQMELQAAKIITENYLCFEDCVNLLRTKRKIKSDDMKQLADKHHIVESESRYSKFIKMFGEV
jgi:cell division protease FtsH